MQPCKIVKILRVPALIAATLALSGCIGFII